MKLTVEIELGNDAMQDYDDLSGAMRHLMRMFDSMGGDSKPEDGDSGMIHDLNGNRVGKWQVVDE